MQWAMITAFCIATALLLWRVWRSINLAALLLPLPYSIDYGEGIVMQQAMMILGPRMYGDINVYPYIVFHYPPLYHLTVRAIAAVGADLLYAGRGLSMASTAAVTAFVGALIFRSVRARATAAVAIAAGVIGGGTVLTDMPIVEWSPIMRVDMFAIALSFAGVYLAVLSTRRPALLYVAALAFVLSIYTKQTMIAAPAATFATLWLRAPRSVRGPIVFGFGLSAAALAGLCWETNGGFLQHIVLYNFNRFSLLRALMLLGVMVAPFALYLVVAVAFGLVHGWRRLRAPYSPPVREQIRHSDEALILVIMTAWFGIAAVTLVTLGKSGGYINYFIEWMCVCNVLIGVAAGNALDAMRRSGHAKTSVLLAPVLLAAQLLCIQSMDNTSAPKLTTTPVRQAMDHLFHMVQGAQKPVLSDDMVLLLRAGKEVPIEPEIFADLGSLGQWDQRRLIDLINLHAFAFIVTQYGPGNWWYDQRYTKPVQAAIATNYPHQERYADYVVMRP
jgi:hypothetical protein